MSKLLANAPLATRVTKPGKGVFVETRSQIGTTPNNALRMFVSAFNGCGGFPFDSSNPCGFNAETLAAMDDAVSGRNLSGPFASTEEMWAAVFDDEE